MPMWQKIRTYDGLPNLFALYGLYGSGYLLALVTVPYLTRVLGPASWGLVAFVQAFGGYMLIAVEFGFTLSATREVARHRAEPDQLAEVLAGVMGAKVALALVCIGLSLAAQHWVGAFREHPLLFWCGVFWALVQGSSLHWYYQGLERMRVAVAVDVSIKTLALFAVFVFVRAPEDGWKVLALQGLAALISLLAMLGLAYRDVPFRLPTFSLTQKALQRSLTTFIPRNALILYSVGNAFILGLFAPPQIVGYYAAAERISRAITGLLGPVSEGLYPRISRLAQRSHTAVRYWARVGLVTLGTAGLLMGVGIYVFAPELVRLLGGQGFEPAVPVLRIFAILPPVMALRNVLGIHWMLPLDLDFSFNLITVGAGVLNIGLAVFLAPHQGQAGVAWASVIAQIFAAVGAYGVLRWMRLDPLAKRSLVDLNDGNPEEAGRPVTRRARMSAI